MIRLHAIPVLLFLAVTACSGDSNRLLPFEPSAGAMAASVARIPKPQLRLDSIAPATVPGYLLFDLSIRNSSDFPDAMFTPAPHLPPCGFNANASRSWVSIYDKEGNHIYGFCALRSAAELNHIWFALPPNAAPSMVYVVIWDRETNERYTSNRIPIPKR
jgi:hypothetical protein